MKKAFTLIEVLTSVALLAVLAVAVNTYLISSLKSARKAAANSIIKGEGELIQTNIVQTVTFAKRINSCTASSLSVLASDGGDVIFEIVSNRFRQSTDLPDVSPPVLTYLSSTKTSVAACSGGNAFVCTEGGKSVEFCFTISTIGIDSSDNSTMTFRDFIYSNN